MRRRRTVEFKRDEWLPIVGDSRKYALEYSVVDTDAIGAADESSLTEHGRIVVRISRTLLTLWGFEENDPDLKAVLFEYAKRHIKDKMFDGTLSDYEELQLTSHRAPEKCPYDATRIKVSLGTPFEFLVADEGPFERSDRRMADHVFISYSRKDQDYARKLEDELRKRGFDPWVDARIDFGDRWWRTIVQQIRSCAAFVVVMTPDSEESHWVEKEVMLALEERKPVFPLLLRGKRFPILIDRQYVSVSGGRLPPRRFYERLGREARIERAPEELKPAPLAQRSSHLAEPPIAAPEVVHLGIAERTLPFQPEMILIPAGEFLMGSDPQKDKDAYNDQQPQHTLYLPDYYMAKTPVTQAQYVAFVQATGHRVSYADADWAKPYNWSGTTPPRDKEDHPVVLVSWHDAIAYCNWLAETSGKPYRLPSEAEWEKGARGIDGRIYPWGDEWDASRCNSREGGKGSTTPVGAYPEGASPYGLLGMSGNVWEWMRSKEASYPYLATDGREDLGGSAARVVRGGSWYGNERLARCASRYRSVPGGFSHRLGFRLVVSLASSEP